MRLFNTSRLAIAMPVLALAACGAPASGPSDSAAAATSPTAAATSSSAASGAPGSAAVPPSPTPVPLSLAAPDAIAIGGDGEVYIADCLRSRVFVLDSAGVLSPFAGYGAPGHGGDGGQALDAKLDCPSGIALDSAGNAYIVDHISNRVRRVDPAGVITTVVGSGPVGWQGDETTGEEFFGDGGPAVEAALNEPGSIAIGDDGSLYIGDRDNRRIRRVDPDGVITTFAGNGEMGSGGDGGPAVEAELTAPTNVALGPDGTAYILDVEVDRIRMVGADGVIWTIAGTGERGFSGDGGSATAAQLFQPRGIAVGAEGNLYISDMRNQRIRRVAADGTITTIAGTGERETSGDGGPATEAGLSDPHALTFDAAGNLYFVDFGSLTIRMIDTEGVIHTVGPMTP